MGIGITPVSIGNKLPRMFFTVALFHHNLYTAFLLLFALAHIYTLMFCYGTGIGITQWESHGNETKTKTWE